MAQTPAPEHLLAALLESTEEAVLGMALDGTIQTWSPGAERIYGYTETEMVGQRVVRLLPLYEVPAHEQLISEAWRGDFAASETTERVDKQGSTIRVSLKRAPIRGPRGEVVGILECAQRISRNAAEKTMGTQLRMLADQMPLILWTTDHNLHITSNWGAGLQTTRIRPGEFVGRTVYEYLKSQDPHTTPIAEHYDALRGATSHFEFKRGNRVLEVHLAPLRAASGEIIGCIGAALDITERRKNEEQIRYQATHDALTGLANYREFMDTLHREVRRAERAHHSFTVLLLDMNDLKRVNDRFGHLAGNRALKRLAVVISAQCRSTDVAARYGGDEFAVVLIDSDAGMAAHVAERIETSLRKDSEEPSLSVSLGIGIYPDDGRTAHELLEAADRQLYRRKKASQSRIMTAP